MKNTYSGKTFSASQSGIRISLFSLLALVAVFIVYGYTVSPVNYPSSSGVGKSTTQLATGVFLILFTSISGMVYGVYRIGLAEKIRVDSLPITSPNLSSVFFIIVDIMSHKKYRRVFLITSISYALFFSFVSQIIIFSPYTSFSQLYQVSIPSVKITTCCNFPGFVPILSAYLLDNLIVLIIPINVLLVVIISFLVGVNLTVTLYVFQHNSMRNNRNKSTSCLGAVGGALSGLFTACPICAGTLFSIVLGIIMGLSSLSAVTLTVLTPYQALFIFISIPMLLLSSYITAKSIRTSYRYPT